MSLSRWVATCFAAAWAVVTAPAHAEIAEDCAELGIAITEHSCFHSEFGPFETVMATAGTMIADGTPNIDPVHTEYRVGLAGEYSVVTYTPKRSGAWAVLLGKDVPLQVLAGEGERLPSLHDEYGTTGCEALPLLHVFHFDDTTCSFDAEQNKEVCVPTKYRFVFGPTSERTVVSVVEYIDDFLTQNGRDEDGDGFGSKADVIVSPCEPPASYAPNTRDCDDTDPLINPGTAEACDGIDQNCNGVADDVGLSCRAGAGACRVEGKVVCAAGSDGATCSATPLESSKETCNGIDDDCNGKIDDAEGLCTDPDRPTCVRFGMAATCGCRLDLDCGDVTSGRICNTQNGVCEDGCSPLPGANGCRVGEACNEQTARCEPGGDGGASGVAGAGGDASVSGSSGVSGSAPSGSGGTSSEGGQSDLAADSGGGSKKDGGCGCRVARQQHGSGALSLLGLVLGLAHLRRRRHERARLSLASAAVGASLLVACGGRTQDVIHSGDGGAGAAPVASGGSNTAGSSSSGGTVSGGAAAGDASAGGAPPASPDCVPQLGEQLIEHACSHTTNGPFIPVVAGADAEPPDVSELHRTYEIQVVGSEAHVLYRAQREGGHAFMTKPKAAVELRRAGIPLSTLPSFAVEGCGTIESAIVYDLQRDAEYDLYLIQSPPTLNLFVEHLAAFGSEAWLEPCDGE